jgi:hypothetical protein
LSVLLLAALPAVAGGVSAIESGIDVWYTVGDGTTFVDFAKMPIPKGFFCDKSAPFTDRVVLRGRPLATGNPNELGGADTVVQRLDRAPFDASGVAATRIQLRALQLESVAPIKTACGDYHVQVVAHGPQPISRMKILKETAVSGSFVAPIRVNFKMTFTPVNGAPTRRLELLHSFYLQPGTHSTWGTVHPLRASSRVETLAVDTDGDQIPDAFLPKTSGNFLVGLSTERLRQIAEGRAGHGQVKDAAIDQPVTCSDQVNYDGYGTYGCHIGPDPSCHPHTEATGVHCSRPCEPCSDSIELPPP